MVPRRAWPALPLLGLLLPAVSAAQDAWFTEISAEVGIRFVHDTGALGSLEMPESIGSGCAIFDADADGDLDLYLLQGSYEWSDPDREDGPVNTLYLRQDDGTWKEAGPAGAADPGYGMGVACGDVNGDGLPDLYVTNSGPDRLWINEGSGRFRDATEEWGLDSPEWGCSVAFVDYDVDGDPDVYVTRYVAWDPSNRCSDPAGRPEYCGPLESPPAEDLLLRNDGGRFTDVTGPAGIAGTLAAGLGVTCADFDGDSLVDIYVANDAYANNLWINRGDGTFVDDALLLGAAFNVQGMAEAGMGVLTGDFDGDLDLDLFMTHLRNESNTLYARDEFGFEDRTAEFGLATGSLPTTGFGTVALDVELDGDLDLFVGNGSVNRGEPREDSSVPPPWDRYAEPNHLYLQEDGRFALAPPEVGGEMCARVEVTRGVAVGDVDDDGDLDVLVMNTHAPARLFRNDAPRRGRWVRVAPVDPRTGAVVAGSLVVVRAGGGAWLRQADPAFSFLSSSDPRAHFGLGPVEAVDAIEVRWPDGSAERFPGGAPDRDFRVVRGQGEPMPAFPGVAR